MSERGKSRVDRAKEKIGRISEADMRGDLGRVHNHILESADKPIHPVPLKLLAPAPFDWNFFPPISEAKMLEMMLSIQENGLFNPVILWKRGEGYTILSGHNRVDAYRRILIEYGETEGFNPEEYQSIPAIIYGEREIDENKAKEIVIDTNYIQRDEDRRLMPTIVKNRIDIIRNRKDKKGRTIEIAAKELGLSRTKVYEDYIIGENIIPELSNLFFDGKITKKALLRFATFNKGVQQYVYEQRGQNISSEKCMKIRKDMTRKELVGLFTDKPAEKIITMQIRVPESVREDFRKMAKEWLEERRGSLKGKEKEN